MGESSSDEEAAIAIVQSETLPQKSSERYLTVYNTYKKWQEENKNSLTKSDESNLILYFDSLKKKLKPPSLWSVWSMLRTTLKTKDNVDISNFLTLKTLLKSINKGYKPEKTLTFKWNQIMKFMIKANDREHLGTKVILIFGICGGLRCDELTNMKIQDVEDLGDKFLVSTQYNKKQYAGQFIIRNLFYDKVKKYISLRPTDQFSDRFFIQYHKGKCTRQPIGKHKIGEVPQTVAYYLNLENPEKYTGHCFKKTAKTLLSETGSNMQMMQLGLRSDIVIQGYIQNSGHNKQLICNDITHTAKTASTLSKPSTSAKTSDEPTQHVEKMTEITEQESRAKITRVYCNRRKAEQTLLILPSQKELQQKTEQELTAHSQKKLLYDNTHTTEIKSTNQSYTNGTNNQKAEQILIIVPSNEELQSMSHDNAQKISIKNRDEINSDYCNKKTEQEVLNAHSQELLNTHSQGLLNVTFETSERNASGNTNCNFDHYNNTTGRQNNSRTSISNTTNGTLLLNTSVWAQIKEVQSEIEETTSKLMKLHKKLAMLIKVQDNHTRTSNETSLNEGAKKNVENGAASHPSPDEIVEVTIKNEIDSEESDDLNTVETVWFPELNIKNEDDSQGSTDLINTEETDWLTEVSPLKSPYYPQIDDLVMYFPQGYQTYLQAVKKYQIYDIDDVAVPYMDFNLTAHQLAKVVAISYENYPPRVSRLQLQPLSENGDPKGDSFEVVYHNVNGVVDFLIQKHLYDASLTNSWNEGDRFRSTIDDDVAFGYVESIEPYNEKFPDSLFKRYRVRFDDDTEFKLSPWELEPFDNPDNQNETLYKCQPGDWIVDGKEVNKEKIMECLQEVVKLPIAKPFLHLNKEASYTSYVSYPIDLSTILARYENNFYRRINSMKFDIESLAANIEEIIRNPNAANVLSKRKKDNFKHYKIINEVLLTILEDPENTDVYDLHEHLKESQEENDDPSVNYEPPIRLQESLHSCPDNGTSKTCKGDWINACKELFNKISKDEDSQPFRKNAYPINLDCVNENLNKDVYISPSAFCRDMRAVFSSSKFMGTQAKMQEDRLRKLFNGEMNEIISFWKTNRKFKELSGKIVNKRKSNSSNDPNEENLYTQFEKRSRRSIDEAGPSGMSNKLDKFDNTISENVTLANNNPNR